MNTRKIEGVSGGIMGQGTGVTWSGGDGVLWVGRPGNPSDVLGHHTVEE